MIGAVVDGLVKQVNADIVTGLLESLFSLVTGNSVSFSSLYLGSLVHGVVAGVFKAGKLFFLISSSCGFLSHFIGESDAVVVSILDGFLGAAVPLDDLLLEVNAGIKSVLGVVDLAVELSSVISPGEGVLVTANFELLAPCSQKLEESSPLGVIGHVVELPKLVDDILVHSEVSSDAPVDVLEVHFTAVVGLTEGAATAGIDVNDRVRVVLGVVVDGTLGYHFLILLDFVEFRVGIDVGASEDDNTHGLIGRLVGFIELTD